jgi:hypothetical protein
VNVQPADIVLYRVTGSSNWLDKLIGWGQRIIHQAPSKATYCHVAIVGPDTAHIYEARWPRIQNSLFDLSTIEKTLIVEVYRVKTMTPEQISGIMAAAHKRIGQRYDVLAILTFGILQIGPAAVCSQYVYECFLTANVVLCPWESLESPDDIAASALLERVK